MLVYGTAEQQYRTLDQLVALGADRIRVSVFWEIVAPDPKSRTKPAGFDARDPEAYPAGAWDRYDRLLRAAAQRGIAVNFNITSPAPLWATGDPGDREDLATVWAPSAQEFGEFVLAVGRRYSGEVPGIPRVSYWSIWNEPNQGAWLAPQFVDAGNGTFVEASPKIYRAAGRRRAGRAGSLRPRRRHDPDRRDGAQGQQRRGRLPRDGAAALHPAPLLPRRQRAAPARRRRRGARLPARGPGRADARRASRPLPHQRLGAPPLRADALARARPTSREFFTTGNLRDLSSLMRRIYLRYGQPLPGRLAHGLPALPDGVRLPDRPARPARRVSRAHRRRSSTSPSGSPRG